MKRRRIVALMTGLLMCLLPGCAAGSMQPEELPGGHAFTDGLGRQVEVERPQRVAALMGGFAETWLLAGGELAGATTDALEERNLELSPNTAVMGAYNSPSLEAVIGLEPDLVLLSAETAAHVALEESLSGAGIPAAYFRVNHFEDYLEMLRTCTLITGREDLYEQNGLRVRAEVEAVLERRGGEAGPRVLLLVTHSGGAAVQNGSTMAGRMLAELGCVNMADENPSLLKEFSMEHILASEPDVLLVIPMGNDGELAQKNLEQALEGHPAWGSLGAVQNGRYHLLPRELFLYKPNARWGESYEYLEGILFGEA